MLNEMGYIERSTFNIWLGHTYLGRYKIRRMISLKTFARMKKENRLPKNIENWVLLFQTAILFEKFPNSRPESLLLYEIYSIY